MLEGARPVEGPDDAEAPDRTTVNKEVGHRLGVHAALSELLE